MFKLSSNTQISFSQDTLLLAHLSYLTEMTLEPPVVVNRGPLVWEFRTLTTWPFWLLQK